MLVLMMLANSLIILCIKPVLRHLCLLAGRLELADLRQILVGLEFWNQQMRACDGERCFGVYIYANIAGRNGSADGVKADRCKIRAQGGRMYELPSFVIGNSLSKTCCFYRVQSCRYEI
jgi:hypothetical protein